jgi:hypothetical protein
MKIQRYKWGIAGIIVLATTFTLIAWTGSPQGPDSASNLKQDTIPAKKRTKETRQAGDRDFDKELRAIDRANKELGEKDWDKMQLEINEAMGKVDFEKIQADIDKAMKSVDFEKIQKEIAESMSKVDFDKMSRHWEDAMKKIDFEKINREIEESMKKADFDKINPEWKESMNKVDFEKLQKEVKESMDKLSKVDMKKIEEDMRKAQKEIEQELREAQKWNNDDFKKEMEKVKKEMEELKLDLSKEEFDFKGIMEKATEGVQKAKEELKGYQEMVYAMEEEGLLSTKGDYTIEYRNGEISINGKKQSPSVSNKYKKYFKKDKVTIEKEDGEINIRYGSSNTHID